MAKRKNPAAVALGKLGGKAAKGRGASNWWDAIPAPERSRIMKERAKKRKARKKS